MSTEIESKINQLLQLQPSGVIFLSSWLSKKGYNADLQKRYRKSNWLQSIGTGAMIRTGDKVTYEGALYALQYQADFSIHPGGKSALSLLGKAHYLEFANKKVTLFGSPEEKLPPWFKGYDWRLNILSYNPSFLPKDLGIVEVEHKAFKLKVSGAARAIMECLYLSPEHQELMECYELMEGLNNLRPTLVQELLEKCTSVKVKRLFLFFAEKAGHDWINYLDLKKIDVGKGKRNLIKGGIYIAKYKITVNRELAGQNE